MSQIKNQLSSEYRSKRSQMDFQLRERESEATCARVRELPEWKEAQHIMIYLAAEEELDTIPFLKQLLEDDEKTLYVPFIEDRKEGIKVSLLEDYVHLAPGMFNILEPRPQHRTITEPMKIDLICVPGIVFDRSGGRIGFGHGYYDWFLKKTKALKVGFAYEFQVLQEIPQGPYDVPVDMLVTASEVIDASAKNS